MLGSIIGDVAGSRFEFRNKLTRDFELLHEDCCFSDDTVMTCAIADALLRVKKESAAPAEAAVRSMQAIGQEYPYCGYGSRFIHWMFSEDPAPLNSLGNGAAMRIAPAAAVAESEEELKELVREVTRVSHDHPEGLKAAEATAMAGFLARNGLGMDEIRARITADYYPEIAGMHVEDLHGTYRREVGDTNLRERSPYSVPQALVCFFESGSFEEAVRNCVYIGGDCDTTGAIAGGIAEYYYGVPETLRNAVMGFLDERLSGVVKEFYSWTDAG